VNRNFLDHLEDMLEFATKAREFLGEMSWEEFAADDKTLFANIRALEVIGEAARRIPADTQKQYSSIPWQRIIGMRNILAHNYDNADPRIIYDTTTNFLPTLIAQLRIALDDAKKKS
jgi:uncharacterized protein with HEPN domain